MVVSRKAPDEKLQACQTFLPFKVVSYIYNQLIRQKEPNLPEVLTWIKTQTSSFAGKKERKFSDDLLDLQKKGWIFKKWLKIFIRSCEEIIARQGKRDFLSLIALTNRSEHHRDLQPRCVSTKLFRALRALSSTRGNERMR